jgi:GNAT superfamily N-acetyltransferase
VLHASPGTYEPPGPKAPPTLPVASPIVTDHPPHQPIADSVRLALPSEATAIATMQRRSWSERLPAEFAELLLTEASLEEMAELWTQAISRPPEARFRVLIALGNEQPVGFATTTPSPDGDADARADGAIDEFVVDRPAQRQGHGSRLLNACADTLRADGFTTVRWWLPTTDDITRTFLTEAGWQPDGAHREIGTEDGSIRLKQIRLHTDISEAPPA